MTYTVIPPASKLLLGTFTLNNPGIGETVRRTRGLISVGSDQSVAIENQLGAVGLVVINDVALTLGITAIPDPVSNDDDDGWFVFIPFVRKGINSTGNSPSTEFEFDSKAMRRVEEGFGIAIVVANASLIHGFEVAISMRMLTSLS